MFNLVTYTPDYLHRDYLSTAEMCDMSLNNLRQAQQNFARLNLNVLQSTLSSITNNRERALAFVSQPDEFIKNIAKSANLPEKLHCHIQMEDEIKPVDPEGDNQMVLVLRVPIDSEFYDEVYNAFKTSNISLSIPSVAGHNPCDDIGCGECLITKLYKQ